MLRTKRCSIFRYGLILGGGGSVRRGRHGVRARSLGEGRCGKHCDRGKHKKSRDAYVTSSKGSYPEPTPGTGTKRQISATWRKSNI